LRVSGICRCRRWCREPSRHSGLSKPRRGSLWGEAYTVSGYVLAHEAGDAFTIKQLRRRAYRLMELLGLRRVRLYDARSSCFTFLANNVFRTTSSRDGPDIRT
jgi:hypothetical protein